MIKENYPRMSAGFSKPDTVRCFVETPRREEEYDEEPETKPDFLLMFLVSVFASTMTLGIAEIFNIIERIPK